MAELTMPRLSDTMEEGTVGRWLKQPGEQVEKGEIIAEIETDKATMELEAFESGTLQKIVVNEGQTVPIGATIAIIGMGEGSVEVGPTPAPPAETAEPQKAEPAATERQPEKPPSDFPSPAQTNGHAQDADEHIKASPVARRLAAEYGIDLRMIKGSGPGGRIIKENVEAFHSSGGEQAAAPERTSAQPRAPQQSPEQPSAPAPAPERAPERMPAPAPAAPPAPAGTIVPMSRMRRAIARNMTQAKPGMPHIYVTAEVDMDEALKLRKQINEGGASPVKISVNDLVIKAVAKALVKFSALNSSYATDPDGKAGVIYHPRINVCVAVAIDEGLVAPVVFDADKKSLSTISAEVKDMASRAREGRLKQEELDGGTFTLSNLGMYDVIEFGAVITSPQAAILAIGAVRAVPVVRQNEIVIGQTMHITVSADHRVTDGAVAAQFLQEVTRLLETPMSLLV